MRIGQVVVAGAGLAGLRTAEELRARGYQGTLTMIGAEPRPPYDRPPLTKKFMTGEIDDTSLRADMDALSIDLRLGEAATGLADGVLRTAKAEFAFDALVIATGATPVRLPGPGPQRVLRTFDQATALRSALRPGLKLAVVGAGWIGAELATSATRQGCQVTVVEAAPAPLAGALGAEAGSRTVPWYAAAGVELRLGQPVESVEPGGLALPGGGWLPADEVVTAVGVRPEVGWLAGSGVLLESGVAGDERPRARRWIRCAWPIRPFPSAIPRSAEVADGQAGASAAICQVWLGAQVATSGVWHRTTPRRTHSSAPVSAWPRPLTASASHAAGS